MRPPPDAPAPCPGVAGSEAVEDSRRYAHLQAPQAEGLSVRDSGKPFNYESEVGNACQCTCLARLPLA